MATLPGFHLAPLNRLSPLVLPTLFRGERRSKSPPRRRLRPVLRQSTLLRQKPSRLLQFHKANPHPRKLLQSFLKLRQTTKPPSAMRDHHLLSQHHHVQYRNRLSLRSHHPALIGQAPPHRSLSKTSSSSLLLRLFALLLSRLTRPPVRNPQSPRRVAPPAMRARLSILLAHRSISLMRSRSLCNARKHKH